MSEDQKLTVEDLDVLACAGSATTIAGIRAKTGLPARLICDALKRASDNLPRYQSTLLQQAADPTRSPQEQRMARDASRSISGIISWVFGMLPSIEQRKVA